MKSGSKAIIKGATVKKVIKSELKPTVGAVLNSTVDWVVSNLIQIRDNHAAEHPPNSTIVVFEIVEAGSHKKRRCAPVYKKWQNVSSIPLTDDKFLIIFKMLTMKGYLKKEITSEVNLFGSIMQQNVMENQFNSEYAPLTSI